MKTAIVSDIGLLFHEQLMSYLKRHEPFEVVNEENGECHCYYHSKNYNYLDSQSDTSCMVWCPSINSTILISIGTKKVELIVLRDEISILDPAELFSTAGIDFTKFQSPTYCMPLLYFKKVFNTINKMEKEIKKIYSYSVFYEAAPEGGYVAIVPALPGCHSQGETFEETEKNIKKAIELYLESLINHKEKVREELKSFQGTVQIPVSLSH